MTDRSRSARLRGDSLVLRALLACLCFFNGRTSTSVPSGSAFGSSSRTLPFLTVPRTVIFRSSRVRHSIVCVCQRSAIHLRTFAPGVKQAQLRQPTTWPLFDQKVARSRVGQSITQCKERPCVVTTKQDGTP